jgi:uncharacterized membrane protein YukC
MRLIWAIKCEITTYECKMPIQYIYKVSLYHSVHTYVNTLNIENTNNKQKENIENSQSNCWVINSACNKLEYCIYLHFFQIVVGQGGN